MKRDNDPFFPDGLPNHLPEQVSKGDAPRTFKRPSGLATVPDPMALARALRRHWLLALSLGLLGAAITGNLAWRLFPKPKYTASTLLEVKTNKPILLMETGLEKTDFRIFQSTQLALIKSKLVLNAALARPGIAGLTTIQALSSPLEWLDEELLVEFPSGSELLRVSLSGQRPNDLAAIVNAVTAAYLEQIVSKDYTDRVAKSTELRTLLDQYNGELKTMRASLKNQAETVGSDDKTTLALKQHMAVEQVGKAKSELWEVQSSIKRAEAEIKVLKQSGVGYGPRELDLAVVEAALANEPSLEKQKLQIDVLSRKLRHAGGVARSPADSSLRVLSREHKAAVDALEEEQKRLRPKIENQLRSQNVDREALKLAELETLVKVNTLYEEILLQQIERLDKEAQTFNRQTIDIQWLKDEIMHKEETARSIGKELEALNVELKAPQRGRVIEHAENPRMESPKKRLAAVGLASASVFALAILGVAWREYQVRRVDHPDEVTDGLGLRLMGTLPALPSSSNSSARGRAGSDRWQNHLVESVDAARTVLLRDCRACDLQTIMITSASKGEGKSSLSSHLAVSLSRTGRRTLLIDFDLRRPSLHRLFDLPRGPGVSELLRGEANPLDVAHSVARDLDVITAGESSSEAIRALAHDALPALIAKLSECYELVVIDSAPVLPVADSLLISQHVDAVLFSVYRDVSRIPAVHAGYERLAALGVRILGAVVTGVSISAEHYTEEYVETTFRGS